ncbi:predicted protein, partial [Arabidopsis lyrata subsp. lyrata]
EKKAVRVKDEKIEGLEEQLGKLMAQMDGESEVSETKEVQDATVLPLPTTSNSSSASGNVIHANKKKSNRRKG